MVLGLLALLAVLAARRDALLLPQVALAPAALAAVVLLQLALGMVAHNSDAWLMLAYLGWSMLMAMAGRSAMTPDAALLPTLAWCMLAGGAVNAMFGLLQFAGLSAALAGLVVAAPASALEGVYGNLAQQNHFAAHVALALASAVFLRADGRLGNAGTALCTLILGGALALSGSRTGLLFVGWIVLACWMARRRDRNADWHRLLWLGGACALALAALWLASRYWLPGSQLARLFAFSEGAGPRLDAWRHAGAMFADHPLLGVGIDRFAHHMMLQLQDGHKVWGIDQYAHNLGLQLLAVTGIAGFAAIAIPLGLFVRRVAAAPFRGERMWVWAVFGILFIHSMLEQPLHYAYFLGIAAFVAGASDPAAWLLRLRLPGRALLAALACVGLVALAKTAADYRELASGFYSTSSGDTHDAHHRAISRRLGSGSIFAPLVELISPETFVPVDAPVNDKLAFNTRLLAHSPVADVAFRQAALLAEAGRLEQAKAQFRQAALAYPDVTAAYVQRFIALAQGGDPVFGELAAFAAELTSRQIAPDGARK